MTIEIPLALHEMRQYQVEQNRISDARIAVFRLAGRSRNSYRQAMRALQTKGINLAAISFDDLKREVEMCRKARRR